MPTTIPLFPTPLPNSGTQTSAQFDAAVQTLVDNLNPFGAAANTLGGEVEANAAASAASAAAALADKNTATTQAGIATAQAVAAAASALTAVNAPGTSATSTTSITFGAGSKTLTIQTGKSIVPTMHIIAAKTSAPEQYMRGIVTSYDTGTGELVFTSDARFTGSGSNAAWTVSLSGAPGIDGVNGRQYIDGATTLIAGITYDTDSTAGAFTVQMPATPTIGDSITLIDLFGTWATNPVALARNGSNFVNAAGASVAEDFELNSNAIQEITFIYISLGWRAI